jgi:uncharacterized membrane protein YhdT
MSVYLDIMKYKTRYQAQKACPWACKITKCYMGWLAFANLQEYDKFRKEMNL